MHTITIEVPDDDFETALEHVLALTRLGYTAGIYPYWEIRDY